MDRCRSEALFRFVTRSAGSRRQLTGGLLGSSMAIALARLNGDETRAKKKRKKKKKKKVTCPSGETRCPKGFPSSCCAADTSCCDTSRVGCCAV
jgi:hypothetical protein